MYIYIFTNYLYKLIYIYNYKINYSTINETVVIPYKECRE